MENNFLETREKISNVESKIIKARTDLRNKYINVGEAAKIDGAAEILQTLFDTEKDLMELRLDANNINEIERIFMPAVGHEMPNAEIDTAFMLFTILALVRDAKAKSDFQKNLLDAISRVSPMVNAAFDYIGAPNAGNSGRLGESGCSLEAIANFSTTLSKQLRMSPTSPEGTFTFSETFALVEKLFKSNPTFSLIPKAISYLLICNIVSRILSYNIKKAVAEPQPVAV